MRALCVLALVVLPIQAFAQAAPLISKAEKELENLEYAAAAKLLDAALKVPGNDRATVLKIFELQAVAFATTGQDAKAAKAFHSLLSLAPDFKLVGNHPPRVSTAYYEALGWLDSNRPVEAKPLEPMMVEGKIARVRLELVSDPAKLVKEVRFHVNVDGKTEDVDVPVVKAISAAAGGARVVWWAELLGEKKAVLASVGSAAAPRAEGAAAVVVAAPPPKVEPVPVVVAPTPVVRPPAVSTGRTITGTRVASIVVMGAGAAALGVGIFFGVSSNATTAAYNGATTDSAGRVTSLSRKDALALDSQQRMQATIANALIISGSALAAGGVVLFAVGGASGARASLVPAGAGAALVGTFP